MESETEREMERLRRIVAESLQMTCQEGWNVFFVVVRADGFKKIINKKRQYMLKCTARVHIQR